MSDKIDISMDLETWGNRPGSDIRSIGACVFHPTVGWTYPDFLQPGEVGLSQVFYRACANPLQGSYSSDFYSQKDLDALDWRQGHTRRYQLMRDIHTVSWWHRQPKPAQDAFANAVDLKDALIEFSSWLNSLGVNPKVDNCRIWTHGAAYDHPIITEAFHAVGLPVPWFYRAPRDTRTCFDDAGIDDHSQWMKDHQLGVFHQALDDARSQGWAICDTVARMRGFWRMDPV